jgi:hypothetical protein
MLRDPLRKEINFILKVKQTFIENKNTEAALKIQTILYRGQFTRIKYHRMRNWVVSNVIAIQAFVKMRQ